MSDNNLEVEAWRMLAHRLENERDVAIEKLEDAESELRSLAARRDAMCKEVGFRDALHERKRVVAYARRMAKDMVGSGDSATDVLREFARNVAKGEHLENGGEE